MDNSEMRRNILALVNNDKIFNQIAQEAFNSVDTDQSKEIDKAVPLLIQCSESLLASISSYFK